jgi:hypothetical protein
MKKTHPEATKTGHHCHRHSGNMFDHEMLERKCDHAGLRTGRRTTCLHPARETGTVVAAGAADRIRELIIAPASRGVPVLSQVPESSHEHNQCRAGTA